MPATLFVGGRDHPNTLAHLLWQQWGEVVQAEVIHTAACEIYGCIRVEIFPAVDIVVRKVDPACKLEETVSICS